MVIFLHLFFIDKMKNLYQSGHLVGGGLLIVPT